MIEILAPKGKTLAWYLTMEEYAARKSCDLSGLNESSSSDEPKSYFFTWVVEPTVIFGRHQVMNNEVNLSYCKEHNIAVVQRKSGGGCVYADKGNLMLSYIVESRKSMGESNAQVIFQQFLDRIADVLCSAGLKAVKTEHNDILVDGQKVSGNACYQLSGNGQDSVVTVVHGTMLYDVDFEHLQNAITPTTEKLQKHGVESVRQRVRNLRPLLEKTEIQSIEDLAGYITRQLCKECISLTPEDIEAIDRMEGEK